MANVHLGCELLEDVVHRALGWLLLLLLLALLLLVMIADRRSLAKEETEFAQRIHFLQLEAAVAAVVLTRSVRSSAVMQIVVHLARFEHRSNFQTYAI